MWVCAFGSALGCWICTVDHGWVWADCEWQRQRESFSACVCVDVCVWSGLGVTGNAAVSRCLLGRLKGREWQTEYLVVCERSGPADRPCLLADMMLRDVCYDMMR